MTDNATSASQLVSVSIHDGGGACVDSPNGLAIVNWQKSFLSETSGSSVSDAVLAAFWQGSGIGFPTPPADFYTSTMAPPQPSICLAPYPKTIDDGPITVSGPGPNPLTLTASQSGGLTAYSAALPPGAIAGGSYSVTGNGFRDTETIPPPIHITTNLTPGTKVNSLLRVNWTGGNDQSVVTVQFLGRFPVGATQTFQTFTESQTVRASIGTVAFPACDPPGPNSSVCGPYSGGIEVIVTQQRAVGTPAENAFPPFAIPGFNLGGEQIWNYIWDFRGLSN